jgi:hypothetical protein
VFEPKMTEKLKELKARYEAVGHAMQSGVEYLRHNDPSETESKHLRVGVNMAMCEAGAIVNLLVEKGFFTYEEYYERLIEFIERDVASYQEKLKAIYGGEVSLR